VHLFPAIPQDWKEVRFNKLRTEGAFLITAVMKNGEAAEVTILSEKGGELKIRNPFKNPNFKSSAPFQSIEKVLIFQTEAGQTIKMKG
jgi:alpha-L-fucosidase 2